MTRSLPTTPCWLLLFALTLLAIAVARPALSAGMQARQSAAADDTLPRRTVRTVPRDQPIQIDGQLDEAAWQAAPLIDGFRQREPVEGAPPTERTVVRVLYDDEALYVGARMFDSAPDSILARLGRRDADLEADMFGFFVDPYHDRRSGFYFAVNAAGTLYDGVLLNDDWDDDSWDGVWEGKVQIDDQGWSAELRIPYSQLRFREQEHYVWGVNFRRDIARKNERLYLVYTPRDESGFVSRFVDLVGIRDIEPPRKIEVTPYVTTKAEYTDRASGDPFNDGSSYTPDVGADLKIGITNNLTLNATVNPDFGQVEVDPAVVNLSDVETFFPEKRPFFIEGASIFNFGYGGSNSNWGFNFGTPDFFYSRRIGRAPQGSLPDHDYADRPEGTRILGAAKLTGKVNGNWNLGTVQALTAREMAGVARDGERFEAEVEPRAYYGIVRAQREFQEGHRALGFISTTTARDFGHDPLREEINGSAYAVGTDGWTFLDRDRTWVVTGWMGLSHVRGSEERMVQLQESSLHYFQRPDASHVRVDSSAMSLTGTAGRVMLNKQRGHFYTNVALGFVSPSFDVNDVGFQWRSDIVNGHAVVGYRWTEPRAFYRRINVYTSLFRSLDFGGNTTWAGWWGNTWMEFKNYYSGNIGFAINPEETINNRRTRGGPLTTNPPGWELFGNANTDSRNDLVFGVGFFTYRSEGEDATNLRTEVEWKPAANVSLSLNPEITWNREGAQWVDAFDDPTATATFGRRYVFAELDQITVSSSVRLNWTFTPKLSFQLFAQPLISAGDYMNHKELARPKSYDFTIYGEGASTFDPETLVADPDGDGPAEAIELPNRDFNFKSLRGTAVMRWEFRPGSTLFFVWTQTRSDSEEIGTFHFGPSLGRLVDAHPDNIFMVKLTYWLSR